MYIYIIYKHICILNFNQNLEYKFFPLKSFNTILSLFEHIYKGWTISYTYVTIYTQFLKQKMGQKIFHRILTKLMEKSLKFEKKIMSILSFKN